MKEMSDDSISCVITDPPYKMNHSTGGCTNIGMKNKWKGNIKAGNTIMGFDLSIKFSDWLPNIYRILKQSGHCYIFCNDKNMQELLNESIKVGFRESNILVWIKNNACPNRYYMKNCEFILFLYKGKAKPINNMGDKAAIEIANINGKITYNPQFHEGQPSHSKGTKHKTKDIVNNNYGKFNSVETDTSCTKKYPTSIVSFQKPHPSKAVHPTEKPVELLEYLIKTYSNEGETVLDNCMGSGSTGVAAINTNRRFIGIELDKKYFEIAKGRINEWVR